MPGPTAHFNRCSLRREMCTNSSLRHSHILHLASLLPMAAILMDRCPGITLSHMHLLRTFLERLAALAQVIPAGMDKIFNTRVPDLGKQVADCFLQPFNGPIFPSSLGCWHPRTAYYDIVSFLYEILELGIFQTRSTRC